jgi:hypothetical protein
VLFSAGVFLSGEGRALLYATPFPGVSFVFRDGLGLVLDGVDVGMVDTVSQRLLSLSQHVIRAGQYNDLATKWSEIIYQFLFPARPGLLYTKIGWAIYPRDGESVTELTSRAIKHAHELSAR